MSKTKSSKKIKLDKSNVTANAEFDFEETVDIIREFRDQRLKIAPTVADFKFNKRRVRILSQATDVPGNASGTLYWMSRDQRVQDNWAMLFAQKLALKNRIGFHVCFCLIPKFLDATLRHYQFLIEGLKEVAEECMSLNIQFHLLFGHAVQVLPEFVTKHKIGAVVTDFSPLKVPMKWVQDIKEKLPDNVPFCQVDAHNIVPCWIASEKLEYAARTIRNKINSKLPEFLTDFPPVITHPYSCAFKVEVKFLSRDAY